MPTRIAISHAPGSFASAAPRLSSRVRRSKAGQGVSMRAYVAKTEAHNLHPSPTATQVAALGAGRPSRPSGGPAGAGAPIGIAVAISRSAPRPAAEAAPLAGRRRRGWAARRSLEVDADVHQRARPVPDPARRRRRQGDVAGNHGPGAGLARPGQLERSRER